MAKKKASKTKDTAVRMEPDSWLDEVVSKAPGLYALAASLAPFDDVITEQWVDRDHVGIGFDIDGRVCPSGVYSRYGARIYADRVILFSDMYTTEDECVREQYESDMPRLWSLLRQIPRPVHSFGVWTEALNGGE